MSDKFRDEFKKALAFTVFDAEFWAIGAVIGLLALAFFGVVVIIAMVMR